MSDWEKSGGYANVTPVIYKGLSCVKKTLKPEVLKRDSKSFARFQREYRILKNINHPNLIRVYEVDGDSYIMERADCDLEEYIQKNHLSDEEIDRIIDGIASGLSYLHDQEIIHRDLKPSNVLMVSGVPKISDLGVCKPLSTNTVQTSAHGKDLLGSLRYMSKAHTSGEEPTFHFDIKALGRIIFYMETKKQPPIGAFDHLSLSRYRVLIRATEAEDPIRVLDMRTFNQLRAEMQSSRYEPKEAIAQFLKGKISMTELVAAFSKRRSPKLFEVLNDSTIDIISKVAQNDDQTIDMFSTVYLELFSAYRERNYEFSTLTLVTKRLIELLDKTKGDSLHEKLFLEAYRFSYDFDQWNAMKALDQYVSRKGHSYFQKCLGYLELSEMGRVEEFIERNG